MANKSLIGIAGVHHVVSELSRRGLVALPTVKNTAAYDIVVLNELGTKHANVQVKTSSNKVTFFPMPHPDKVRAGPRDYYVLVRWCEAESRYQCFLLSGKTAKASVAENLAYQEKRVKAGVRETLFPCLPIGNRVRAARWAKAWEKWKL